MNSPWPIIIGFVAIAVTVMVIGYLREQRHRNELAAFAQRLGFRFAPGADYSTDHRFGGFTPFGQGRSRMASHFITGERGGVGWEMFDYRFTTGSHKNRRTHRYGVVVARVPLAFPRISLRPEGVFDKIAALAGFDDIDFQDEQFSRRYHVTADDRRRVYDLVHPKMMEYLLSLPAVHWQVGPGLVLLVRRGRYGAAELERAMGMIEGFLTHIPDPVRTKWSAAPT